MFQFNDPSQRQVMHYDTGSIQGMLGGTQWVRKHLWTEMTDNASGMDASSDVFIFCGEIGRKGENNGALRNNRKVCNKRAVSARSGKDMSIKGKTEAKAHSQKRN